MLLGRTNNSLCYMIHFRMAKSTVNYVDTSFGVLELT